MMSPSVARTVREIRDALARAENDADAHLVLEVAGEVAHLMAREPSVEQRLQGTIARCAKIVR